ncbi:MAG: hypothetical protein ACRETK_09560 [Steroidobacteraceae bacterium]
MRIYDNRYDRERLRFQVAMHFIRLEARTRTIRLWTGLTDDRIRKLYRSYLCGGSERPLTRHRGRSPHRVGMFLRTLRLRHESALLASLCRLLGALPERAPAAGLALALPSLTRGELLCKAYEVYRALVGEPLLGFEHAVFLLTALAQADELICGACRDCRAIVVVDRWSLRPPRCTVCTAEAEAAARAVATADCAAPPRPGLAAGEDATTA